MTDLQRNLTGRFCIDLLIRLWQVLTGIWLSLTSSLRRSKEQALQSLLR